MRCLQSVLVATKFAHFLDRADTKGHDALSASSPPTCMYLDGEHIHYLLQHVLKEVVSSHASRTEVHLLVRFHACRRFGISREYLCRVSPASLSPALWLCHARRRSSRGRAAVIGVVATVSTLGALLAYFDPFLPHSFHVRSGRHAAKVCESRVTLYLHAPAIGIEMQMETVELVLRHDINLLLETYRLEMARHINRERTPTVGQGIIDVTYASTAPFVLQLLHCLPKHSENRQQRRH